MSLAAVLKTRRKELGFTLNDIAQRMGVSEATVQRWESGNIKSLRQGRIAKLAEILNVSPSALMGWEECEEPSSETKPCETSFAPSAEDIALLKKYHALDERGKMMVESVLEAEYQHMQPTLHVVAAANGHGATFEERDELPPLLPEDPPDI